MVLQAGLMHWLVDACGERLQYSHYNAYMGLIVVDGELREGNSTSSVSTTSAVQ